MPSFPKELKKTAYRLRERFGHLFYTHRQSYHFDYKVSLKNLSLEPRTFSLVMPLPQDIEEYQKVLSSAVFSIFPHKQLHDLLYGNRYAVWKVSLEPGELKIYDQAFDVEIAPRRVSPVPHPSFADYKKIDQVLKEKFCTPNPYVSGGDPQIIKFAQDLKKDDDDVFRVVRKINEFTIDYLDYDHPIPGLYSSLESLEKKTVDCGGFDTFFVALCNALGIPARVVSGFWLGYGKSLMHAWAEWMLPDGRWVPADPSVEQLFRKGRYYNTGRFGFIGSDRLTFSVGCYIPLRIEGNEVFTDILQNPFLYPLQNLKEVEMKVECRSNFLEKIS